MTFQSMAATATHQKSARLWCYSYQPIMSARGTRPHARGVAKNSLYLFVTESQRRVPLRLPYQCWAQSVDLRDPWIALRNLWIHTLRRNPWIAQESMDRAGIHGSSCTIHEFCVFRYNIHSWRTHCIIHMDRFVVFTNLKFNYFTHFNGHLQSTEQNHRPSASIAQGGCLRIYRSTSSLQLPYLNLTFMN